MAYKQFTVPDLGEIKIYKRKGNRSLRLSVTSNGDVRVSIPTWAPYTAGLQFAQKRRDWIIQQRPTISLLRSGQQIGKFHRLLLVPDPTITKPTSRIKQTEIIINYPAQSTPTSASVQKMAQSASIRALRRQAEQQLPQRLAFLADQHGYQYGSVSIKQLKGRWGSCDQQQNIVLNLFLMQLPWQCIDYVLLHELTHTVILRHGPPFWQAMEEHLPQVKAIRAEMRTFQPILGTSSSTVVS